MTKLHPSNPCPVRKTSELRQGDVVLCHGMRVLLDSPIQSREGVYWCNGLVLNREDVSNVAVPHSYTLVQTTGEHRWQVQGNDLATWVVEADRIAWQAARGAA